MATALWTSNRAKESSALRSKPEASSPQTRKSDEGKARGATPSMMDLTMRAILAASSPTRSKFAVVLDIATSKRKSRAVGCLRLMTDAISRSISTSKALTRFSVTMTSSATSTLKLESA